MAYDTIIVGPVVARSGKPATKYLGISPAFYWPFASNTSSGPEGSGTIANDNIVVIAGSPEIPVANAIVRVYNYVTGALAWEGTSDSNGNYFPDTLKPGDKYIPVAIDTTNTYDCVASGPVVAVP